MTEQSTKSTARHVAWTRWTLRVWGTALCAGLCLLGFAFEGVIVPLALWIAAAGAAIVFVQMDRKIEREGIDPQPTANPSRPREPQVAQE